MTRLAQQQGQVAHQAAQQDNTVQAIELLKESAVMAIDARALLVKAHGELAKIPGQIGLNVVAWGPTGDCPDNFTGAHATDNVRSLHAA